MKLHWSPRSPFVRKVMIFAHEVGLAGRIETVRTRAAMTQPNRDLMRINPLGKIPTLVTDQGEVLFDSTVICEYLDSLHGGPRYFPQAPGERWQALRWHALADNMLDNLVLWRNELIRPQPQQSPEILAAFDLKIRAALAMLDTEAAALGTAPIGIGHVGIGCALGYIDFRFPELAWRDGHKRIAAWYETFSQRPSIRNTVPVDE
ncbi:MAG: glutathione S-transferase [Betaproteobacteria bacterium RIFCSPLOWO2_02_FULL_67_26]|nr:MAG: glutathione S-transferase [Betaproteobacteria bacterium RIFCSPLOWO2_02_FULL_67_26]